MSRASRTEPRRNTGKPLAWILKILTSTTAQERSSAGRSFSRSSSPSRQFPPVWGLNVSEGWLYRVPKPRMTTPAIPSPRRKSNPPPTRSPTRNMLSCPLRHLTGATQPCQPPHRSKNEGSRRDRRRLRCSSGHHQLPQAALFYKERPLWKPSLKSKKSQIEQGMAIVEGMIGRA
jgi:hypothetical protein